MGLRFPSKNWPKELEDIYYNRFLADCENGRYVVPDSMFSNANVLDCLETEFSSAQIIAKLVKRLHSGEINSILIVGAGSGRLGTQIREILPNVNLFEIDKNEFVAKRLQCKHENDTRRKSYCADACCMPFESGSFDVAIYYSVFRYIKNIDMAVDELMRVTKKNGIGIVAEAKNFHIIDKIKKILDEKNIYFKKNIIPSVRLPHLTFYYYLLTQYLKDSVITKFIDEKKANNVDHFQAAFELAGSSLGGIYTLVLKKTI